MVASPAFMKQFDEIKLTGWTTRKAHHAYPDTFYWQPIDKETTGEMDAWPEDVNGLKKAGYDMPGGAGVFDKPVFVTLCDGKIEWINCRNPEDGEHRVRMNGQPFRYDAQPAGEPDAEPLVHVVKGYQEAEAREAKPRMNGNGNGPNLYRKLAAIMGDLQRIPKNGYNTHFNYPFATESDIADAIRAALAKYGVAFLSEIVSREHKEVDCLRKNYKSGSYEPSKKWTTDVRLRFTFVCADTGQREDRYWEGEADDDQDKGIAKAVTLAQKAFLKSTFNISTGDMAEDPDSSHATTESTNAPEPDSERQQRTPTSKKQSTKTTPPPATTQDAEPFQALKFFAKEFDTGAFYKAVSPLFNATKHRDNALAKYAADGTLTADMTTDAAIEAVKAARAAREAEQQS